MEVDSFVNDRKRKELSPSDLSDDTLTFIMDPPPIKKRKLSNQQKIIIEKTKNLEVECLNPMIDTIHEQTETTETTKEQQQFEDEETVSEMCLNGGNGNNELGVLMSGRKPGIFTKKEVIIKQLTEMAQNGSIPMDLQRQINKYYERQKAINHTIKQRFIQSSASSKNKQNDEVNQSNPCRLISKQRQMNEKKEELVDTESWNCNVFICCFCVFLFILFVLMMHYALDMHTMSKNVIYCDSNSNKNGINCTQCPQFAECANGSAQCRDNEYVLHTKKGCLPMEQYEKRRNGERLFMKLYALLKEQRRKFLINCKDEWDENGAKYGMNFGQIGSYFHHNLNVFDWNETKLDDAMNELLQILWEENEKKQKIVKNATNDAYYAVLSEYEMKMTKDCNQTNWFMLTKVYGMELIVSIIVISIMFFSFSCHY